MQSQIRTINGILYINVIGPKSQPVIALVLEAQYDFTMALAEARENHIEGAPNKGIGAPHIPLFSALTEGLATGSEDTEGGRALQEWNTSNDSQEDPPFAIGLICSHFTVHPIQNNSEIIRLQFSIQTGIVRDSVLATLKAIESFTVSTGPAYAGFFEEELTDWMSVLTI